MIGMEIQSECGKPDGEICDQLMTSMREKGFLLGKTGIHRNVLTFEPPLIITSQELDRAKQALVESLLDVKQVTR